ncbi:MAG: methionine--tRNA ligase [Acidobacteriota bacterium]|nr:methionine--tRNA ligase [Acidobacteriota bacterium]
MRFYLTTPIYYVNSTPHIGHAYTTAIGDMIVRNRQQRGQETFFLTGVDEHATKVYRVAQEQGLEPQEYADRIAVPWRELPKRLDAETDFFIRTSDEGHKRFVRDFLQRMYDNGDVYEDVYAGWYCVGCEAFKTDEELTEDGLCKDHLTKPEWIEEKNYFFRLSAYQDRLLALYDERPQFVLPGFRYNEARSFIAGGLQDFSISRAGQPWGIPLPWDESQVAYVWADALINYLSALTYAREGEDLRDVFWPVAHHLLAKDILRFHCVFWPAMLLSAGYEPPQQLFVHGYLLLDDRKISKSLGNVIEPLELIDVYGSDAVRFWIARAVSFGHDGSASVDSVRERYENELGNDLGNLLSRTTAMVARYRDGTVKRVEPDAPVDFDALREDVAGRMDDFDVTGALDVTWDAVRRLNQYVTAEAPWQLAKDEANDAKLDRVLYTLLDGLTALAVALHAYLPQSSAKILEALRQPAGFEWERVRNGGAVTAEGIGQAEPLFPRIELAATA